MVAQIKTAILTIALALGAAGQASAQTAVPLPVALPTNQAPLEKVRMLPPEFRSVRMGPSSEPQPNLSESTSNVLRTIDMMIALLQRNLPQPGPTRAAAMTAPASPAGIAPAGMPAAITPAASITPLPYNPVSTAPASTGSVVSSPASTGSVVSSPATPESVTTTPRASSNLDLLRSMTTPSGELPSAQQIANDLDRLAAQEAGQAQPQAAIPAGTSTLQPAGSISQIRAVFEAYMAEKRAREAALAAEGKPVTPKASSTTSALDSAQSSQSADAVAVTAQATGGEQATEESQQVEETNGTEASSMPASEAPASMAAAEPNTPVAGTVESERSTAQATEVAVETTRPEATSAASSTTATSVAETNQAPVTTPATTSTSTNAPVTRTLEIPTPTLIEAPASAAQQSSQDPDPAANNAAAGSITAPAAPAVTPLPSQATEPVAAPVAAPVALPATSPVPTQLTLTARELVGRRSSNLPSWLSARFFITPKKEGRMTIGYSLVNTSTSLAAVTSTQTLRIQQDGQELSGTLTSSNSSGQASYLGPQSGEYGSIEISGMQPGKLTLSWEISAAGAQEPIRIVVEWDLEQKSLNLR